MTCRHCTHTGLQESQCAKMSAAELLSKAEELFTCGQYRACEDTLQLAISELPRAFSRQQWSVQCNLLACQVQAAVKAGDMSMLRSLRCKYSSLWDSMRGLPPTPSSIAMETAVACALHQLQLAMVLHGAAPREKDEEEEEGGTRKTYSELIARLQREAESPSQGKVWHGSLKRWEMESPRLSDILGSVPYDSASHHCLVKLCYIRSLLDLISGQPGRGTDTLNGITAALRSPVKEDGSVFQTFLTVGGAISDSSSELERSYTKAWHHYNTGQYGDALQALRPLLHHLTPSQPPIHSLTPSQPPTHNLTPLQSHCLTHPHITSAARLLAGACYFQMDKPNLALCSYQQCVGGHDSSLAILPALQSCVSVFRAVGKTDAEQEVRDMVLQGLRITERDSRCAGGGVLWKTNDDSISILPPSLPGLNLAEATYHMALRSLQLHSYRKAASSFRELTGPLPPSIPPPSTLHLLMTQALMCSGDWREAEEICARVVSTLQPSVTSFLNGSEEGGGERHAVALSQALWLHGLAALHLQRLPEARLHWQSCLQLTLSIQLALPQEQHPIAFSSARQLQVLALNNLSVLSVGLGNHTAALQQLAEVVVVCHPHTSSLTPLYNHCLLLAKLGRTAAAAEAWLGGRGGERGAMEGTGTSRGQVTMEEGRERLHAASKTVKSLVPGTREHQLAAMDVVMWRLWIRQKQRH